jgi:hypothetical protein
VVSPASVDTVNARNAAHDVTAVNFARDQQRSFDSRRSR